MDRHNPSGTTAGRHENDRRMVPLAMGAGVRGGCTMNGRSRNSRRSRLLPRRTSRRSEDLTEAFAQAVREFGVQGFKELGRLD